MKRQLVFLSTLILLVPIAVQASVETDFNEGVTLFNAGNYASAAALFESAQKQGLSSVALHYNLASCYYKLGKYKLAETHYKQVALSSDMRELAEYNLGLIALKQKKKKLALKYFEFIATEGKDQKLVTLSEQQVNKLALRKSAAAQKKEARWRAYISSNFGYDSNINSASRDSVLGLSDSFFDFFAWLDLLITGNRKDGWVADASYYKIDFSDTNDNDEYSINLGLKKALKIKSWDSSVRLGLTDITFGGEDYQRVTRLEVSGRKAISKQDRIYLRYRFDDVNSDKTIYDYLAGRRQRVRVEYLNFSNKSTKQIYYELELNNRGNLEAPTYSYDYSPTRHTVRAAYTQIVDRNWRLKGDLQYRFSVYPESSTVDRQDKQLRLALSADYRFDRTFKVTAKWQFTDNTSTIDRYDYDKYVFKVGLSKAF